MLALIRPAFLFLPDLVGYVFAMAGLSLIFMPEELRLLDKYRRTRLGIALVIFLVGLGAVISNSVQKQEDSRSAQSERDNARAERDKLMMQIARLVAGQAEAAQDTRLARSETRSVRGELDNARKELLASQAANGTATTQTVTTLVTASTSQLQEQIERAKLLPPNPAKLSFGFYSSDVSLFPIMDQAIHPDADGIFILEILGKNTSDVLASRVELWVNLCVECTFVKDPEGFDKLPGMDEHMRHRLVGEFNPGVYLSPFKVSLKLNKAGFQAFDMDVFYSCANCGGVIRQVLHAPIR